MKLSTCIVSSLVLSALALTTALTSPAQAGTTLDLSAGVVFGSFSPSPAIAGLSGKTGLTLAANLDFPINEIFSFAPGLSYVPIGFSVPGFNETIHYIDVPLLVKAKLPVLGIFTPFVAAGPKLGYQVGSSYSVLAAAILMKDINFALTLAGGFEFSVIPAFTTFFRAGYSMGLVNAVEDSEIAGVEAKTKAFQLSLGMVLPL